MRGAAFALILGSVMIALGNFLAVILLHPSVGLSVALMLAGTILVITGVLLAILTVIERRRRA
jgi:hypothetical protein